MAWLWALLGMGGRGAGGGWFARVYVCVLLREPPCDTLCTSCLCLSLLVTPVIALFLLVMWLLFLLSACYLPLLQLSVSVGPGVRLVCVTHVGCVAVMQLNHKAVAAQTAECELCPL